MLVKRQMKEDSIDNVDCDNLLHIFAYTQRHIHFVHSFLCFYTEDICRTTSSQSFFFSSEKR